MRTFLTETKNERKSLSNVEAIKSKTQKLSAATRPAIWNQLICKERMKLTCRKQ